MTVLYFAWVRQRIGRSEEVFDLPGGIKTIAALVEYLAARGGGYADAFADPKRLRAARNQEHVKFDCEVADADEIAFFPPVTGG
jgi:molybdopterin synthase sulfur carrier subunit